MTPNATFSGQAKRDLWIRVKHYHFDHIVPPHLTDHVAAVFGGSDASTKAFASKLARKLKWTTRFALQAIDEYKKFIFLGVVSDFAVTPPKVIDQVWHEHILFSRAYRDFCQDVLGREFDHHPELMATDEQTGVFQAQYAATLEAYEKEFDYLPPAAIWGTPKFSPTAGQAGGRTLKPKRSAADSTSSDYFPLYMFVSDSGHDSCGIHHHSHGGGHGGAHHGDSGGHHGADAGGHDGGGGGGDSGGADGGGGSGCSSGCGGGGCGGS